MPKLFGVDIATILAKELGPGLLPVTLIVVTAGVRGSDLSAGTNPSSKSINGKGFIESYEDSDIDGTLIQSGDRKITLIANTFEGYPVPVQGNKITIEGSTYLITKPVKRDPAAATYTCQVQ